MPLFYDYVRRCGSDLVPEETREFFRRQFEANSLRNVWLAQELVALVEHFETGGVPVVPFKGPILAASLYGDLDLRQIYDLDFVVRRRDVERAGEILESRGYRPDLAVDDERHLHSLDSHCERGYSGTVDPVHVDLHWQFVRRCHSIRIDPDALWERLGATDFRGVRVRTFPAEDSLVLLCVHAYKHCWGYLDLVSSLARLVAVNAGLDWPQVLDRARSAACERIVLVGLLLSRSLVGIELSGIVEDRTGRDRALPALAARLERRLLSGAGSTAAGTTREKYSSCTWPQGNGSGTVPRTAGAASPRRPKPTGSGSRCRRRSGSSTGWRARSA
jgi:hypothetical protein